MSTFGDNPTLSTLGSGGRLKISRGSIHAHVRGTVRTQVLVARVAWGSRGAAQRRLLSGQSCWPITGRSCFGGLSGRRPTSTSGGGGGVHCRKEHFCLGDPTFTTCHFFLILRDLHCFTEPLLPSPSISLGRLSQSPIRGCLSTQLSWFRSSSCLPVPILATGDQNMTSFVPPGSAFVTTRAVLSNLGKRDNHI